MTHLTTPINGDIFAKCFRNGLNEVHRAEDSYVIFRPVESAQTPEVMVDGRPMIMIGSNNYLGLTTHPRIQAAAKEAIDTYGTGCAGSRWLNGNMRLHEDLEKVLAEFVEQEDSVVFSTGYQTNLGAIGCLVGRGELVIIDKLDHASILDGCRMSAGQMIRYRHNDMEDLQRILKQHVSQPKLVVVDGVFSMEGDIARLPEIIELAHNYGARVFLDDAHGIGVLGPEGRGTASHFGLSREVDMIMGTFSKSLAGIGGFVAGASDFVQFVKHASRPLMFSAALPPVLVATVRAAVEVIQTEPELRRRLWANAKMLKDGLEEQGYDTGYTETPIVPVVLGDRADVVEFARLLGEKGVFANPVKVPAVPPGHDLIRTSVMASHEPHHIRRVLDAFAEAGREMGLIS